MRWRVHTSPAFYSSLPPTAPTALPVVSPMHDTDPESAPVNGEVDYCRGGDHDWLVRAEVTEEKQVEEEKLVVPVETSSSSPGSEGRLEEPELAARVRQIESAVRSSRPETPNSEAAIYIAGAQDRPRYDRILRYGPAR